MKVDVCKNCCFPKLETCYVNSKKNGTNGLSKGQLFINHKTWFTPQFSFCHFVVANKVIFRNATYKITREHKNSFGATLDDHSYDTEYCVSSNHKIQCKETKKNKKFENRKMEASNLDQRLISIQNNNIAKNIETIEKNISKKEDKLISKFKFFLVYK